MSTTHLGSLVTGDGEYFMAKPTRVVTKIVAAPDKVLINWENIPREIRGFTIFLGLEDKTIYMPALEVRENGSLYDVQLMESSPSRFVHKYGKRIIDVARSHLQHGTLGTTKDMEVYSRESWMTEEQAQVLADLRDGSL